MNQPRARLDSEVRRQQFEQAAIRLVGSIGFRAVTTDAVAQQAGVSKGLLWRYYANLDDLMQKAAERALRKLEKVIAEDLDLTQSAPSLFKETIRRAAHLPEQHFVELYAIQQIAQNLQLPNGSQALNVANSYGELYAHQAALFARGQHEGHITTNVEAQLLARIYQGAVDAMIDQLMHDPTIDPDHYAASLSEVLLNGMKD